MCFDHSDADWYASVQIVEMLTSSEPVRCGECSRVIPAGEQFKYIFQQEYEECRICEWEEAEVPCEKHDYGETYEQNICDGCQKILLAIAQVEMQAGCPEWSSQPLFGGLGETMDYDRDGRYRTAALKMFPEIESHPFLIERAEE